MLSRVLTRVVNNGYSVTNIRWGVKPRSIQLSEVTGQTKTSGRPRGRPALPLDRMLAAALELVDEQGADALSMRSLAQRLESGTATLYRHFASRSELVAMMVDRLLGEIDLDAERLAALPWQQACTAFAQHMFDALGRHG